MPSRGRLMPVQRMIRLIVVGGEYAHSHHSFVGSSCQLSDLGEAVSPDRVRPSSPGQVPGLGREPPGSGLGFACLQEDSASGVRDSSGVDDAERTAPITFTSARKGSDVPTRDAGQGASGDIRAGQMEAASSPAALVGCPPGPGCNESRNRCLTTRGVPVRFYLNLISDRRNLMTAGSAWHDGHDRLRVNGLEVTYAMPNSAGGAVWRAASRGGRSLIRLACPPRPLLRRRPGPGAQAAAQFTGA